MGKWIKSFMAAHRCLYIKTRGRFGSRFGRHLFLLLHTVGRKSGRLFTTPLSYFREQDTYVLLASNWGRANHPDWLHNLLWYPCTTVQIDSTLILIKARLAESAKYDRPWAICFCQNDQYRKYQEGLVRRIPIAILMPQPSS